MEDMEKFKDKVRKMRQAQKEYFRNRDKNVLMQSKRLEKEVDELLDPPKPKGPEQGELFNWIAR